MTQAVPCTVKVAPVQRAAAYKSLLWRPEEVRAVPVQFVGGQSAAWRDAFLHHANLLAKGGAGVGFVEVPQYGWLRVGADLNDGHWSYVGTDNRYVQYLQKTMNVALEDSAPASEWPRVVCHEVMHYLGFYHEHLRQETVSRLSRQGCYAYFGRFGWTHDDVDFNIFQYVDPNDSASFPFEQNSVMHYGFPGVCTLDGQPILGGTAPTPADLSAVAALYQPVLDGPAPNPQGPCLWVAFDKVYEIDLMAWIAGGSVTNGSVGWRAVNAADVAAGTGDLFDLKYPHYAMTAAHGTVAVVNGQYCHLHTAKSKLLKFR